MDDRRHGSRVARCAIEHAAEPARGVWAEYELFEHAKSGALTPRRSHDLLHVHRFRGEPVGGDQDQCWGVGVGASDAEVVELAAVAQCVFAELPFTTHRIHLTHG